MIERQKHLKQRSLNEFKVVEKHQTYCSSLIKQATFSFHPLEGMASW